MKGLGITTILSLCAISCSPLSKSPGLVNTSALGTLRGHHFERVITHIHTPYSNDACDGKGLNPDGSLNRECLHDLKRALCENHINLSFSTDHVNHMAQQDFESLLLLEEGESVVTNGTGDRVASSIPCSDGFNAIMAPGLEGKLLALGMEKHITGTVTDRETLYGGEGLSDKSTLEASLASGGSNALVAIPHTESRSLDLLRTLNPSAMEIYNLHANLDPKIRKASLGFKPFEHIAKFMNYLLDFFNTQDADYLFVEFFQMSGIYLQKWNTLLSEGFHITGLAAHDSHENVFPQKASDGERLDQHRRMTRMFSNLVLTNSSGIDAIKTSIRDGKVFFVLEGLGTPVGFDFHAEVNGSIVEMGSTATVPGGQSSSILFAQPSVHSTFPGMDSDESPEIVSELHFIDSTGVESVVASQAGGTLVYSDPPAGHYRVHVLMKPLHLEDYVIKDDYVERTYPWIITNPIKVVR